VRRENEQMELLMVKSERKMKERHSGEERAKITLIMIVRAGFY
jgi:hypothetical protein